MLVLQAVYRRMNVSIVIATHGDPAWSEAAWSIAYPSTVNQTTPAFEVIPDHFMGGTLAEARNRAAESASGEWLGFLDADDALAPDYVEQMQRAWFPISHDGIDVLLVPAVQYVENGRCVGEPEIPSWGRPLIEINCAVIGTLIPRELFFDVGGFRELPMYEDWDLWLRCVVAGARLVPVPDAVYCAHRSPAGRNSSGREQATAAYWQIRREHELAFERSRR